MDMKKILTAFLYFAVLLSSPHIWAQSDTVYLFSYFKNNGEDGLHLAYSNDGYVWN